MNLMKPNPELRARIVEAYQNGAVSMLSVATTLGVSDSTVWYHLKKSGVPMRAQGAAIKSRLGACDPKLTATEHPTIQDIAWAAGIYEGEGACSISRGKYATIMVGQKERWLVDRLQALFGGSIIVQQQLTAGRTAPITMHYWSISGARARGFMMTIYKFLSPRRQQRIKEALAA